MLIAVEYEKEIKMGGYGSDGSVRNLSEAAKIRVVHTISEEANDFLKCGASALGLSEDETLDSFIRMASFAIAEMGSRPRRPIDDTLVAAPEQFKQAFTDWHDRTG